MQMCALAICALFLLEYSPNGKNLIVRVGFEQVAITKKCCPANKIKSLLSLSVLSSPTPSRDRLTAITLWQNQFS